MWLIECDGNLLQGKRLWLRPGSKHLFGRTRSSANSERNHVIDNKSVSRKHMLISVSENTNNGSDDLVRSEITISDDSKTGTVVSGERISKSSVQLPRDENEFTVQLGSYDQLFRIKWHPVVFTLAMAPKQIKEKLPNYKAQLREFDISVVQEYLIGQTTHVVADKRNTSKGLQALLLGNYIVTEAYFDDVIKAGTQIQDPEDASLSLPSPLELDFGSNWPSEQPWVPPAGKEPVPRSADLYTPNAARSEVFFGYTFIFGDAFQYESLQAPVLAGCGKAMLNALRPGRTTVEDFATFVRGVAGESGLITSPSHQGSGKHVVVVHPRAKKGFEDWTAELTRDVERQLGQRSIEQNEFLDAILTNNAATLHRPFEEVLEEPQGVQASSEVSRSRPQRIPSGSSVRADHIQKSIEATASNPSKADGVQVPSSEPEQSPPQPAPARRRGRRAVTRSRFKGFDEFDPSQLPKAAPPDEDSFVMEEAMDSQAPMVNDSHLQQEPETGGKKRRGPPSDDSINGEDVVDDLLPAAAAMKRRRLQEGYTPGPSRRAEAEETEKGASHAMLQRRRRAKKETEINVLEQARKRREAEEEAGRQDADSLRNALAGMDIEAIKNLVQVEEMEVLPRPARKDDDDRWDERWNGRKNFKKFRRKGAGQTPMRGQRVIVGLEEVKRAEFGMGGGYRMERSHDTVLHQEDRQEAPPRASLQSAADNTIVIPDDDDDDDDHDDDNDEEDLTVQEADEDDDDEVQVPRSFTKAEVAARRRKETEQQSQQQKAAAAASFVPDSFQSRQSRQSRSTRSQGKPTPTPHSIPETEVIESSVATTTRGKRAAASSTAGKPPPGKKAKSTRSVARDESDASEDDMKFKFGRKR